MKILLLLSLIVASVLNAQSTIQVQIDDGPLLGLEFPTHNAFYGIPFTEPPIGNLRWASPVPKTSWGPQGGVWNATYERPGCPQQCNLPSGVCPEFQTEDCLYLNVYTPPFDNSNGNNPTPLPVMVFIPGGRFEMGGGSTPLYDGAVFVNRTNVILVTINYRLGVLGFLVTPQLKGNYGFQDQLVALQWVQDNIKSFGGDPSQVTVFGQSAGGTSSAIHLVSPKSTNLLSKIIIESNPWSLPVKTVDESIDLAEKFAKDIGCNVDDTSCLLSQSVDSILVAQNTSENSFNVFHPLLTFLPWTPVVDGDIIPDQPLALLEKGQFNKVPTMIGTVHDEALIFVASISEHISELEFRAGLVDIFGLGNSIDIAKQYSSYINSSTDYMLLLSTIGTDYIFVCPTRNAVRSIAAESVPVFQYQFQHVSSFNVYGNVFPQCANSVCHGLELPYVFDTVTSSGSFEFTPQEQQLSYDLIDYWTNFAKSGNPNGPVPVSDPSLPAWPMYTSSTSDQSFILDIPSFVQQGLRSSYCDLYDQIGYQTGW
ncbi:putative cholinesterase [Cavenderia fasciculata]|uniref:Carboxylic ester hydrolase n=1 Tax=Cavenderia fasciculata TaxID=261658 RepID=F4QEG1_CACFS|nr:putative cholinesterase [Cavenderia fasciculata]EGG13274.1 putative cholinesterase [Cavenderia fasciculata]|eukprot:XP_004349973.1 putative cholinesterase [Cavenderia fasciculata]